MAGVYDTNENDRVGREVLESATASADTFGPVEPLVVPAGATAVLPEATHDANLLVV